MPVLDLQARSYEVGRIRTGYEKPYGGDGKTRPVALKTFRFTTQSQRAAWAVADVYGGTPQPWEKKPHHWEVFSEAPVIGVMVTAEEAWLTQWYEMWNRGGRLRQCDSVTMLNEDGQRVPCVCPATENGAGERVPDTLARAQLAKAHPPRACSLYTTMKLRLPDIPGEGIWRLVSKSYYAAAEVRDKAVLLEYARRHNVYLPATLAIEQREMIARGEVTRYTVPVLDLAHNRRQLMTGDFDTSAAGQLPPPPGELRRAITAGPPTPRLDPAPPPAARPPTAEELASEARIATTREHVTAIAERARHHLLADDVIPDGAAYVPLGDFLRQMWKSLPHTAPPAAHDEHHDDHDGPPPPQPPAG